MQWRLMCITRDPVDNNACFTIGTAPLPLHHTVAYGISHTVYCVHLIRRRKTKTTPSIYYKIMTVQDPFKMCLLTKIIIYIDGPCYMSVICSADPRFSYIRNAKSTVGTVPTFIVLGFPDLPFTLTAQNI